MAAGLLCTTNNEHFSELTVEENLEMGAFLREDNVQETIEELYNLFPAMKDKEISLQVNYQVDKDNKLQLVAH